MSIEDNKKVVAKYFEAQATGDLKAGLALLTDDATWSVPGEWEMAGTFNRQQIEKMIEGLNQFEGGLRFKHESITAEEDRVAVYTEVFGKVRDGRDYHNTIFFLFRVKDGKIRKITEVVDSHKSRQFWLGK
jgi:ketosteroid isomerase-like protein